MLTTAELRDGSDENLAVHAAAASSRLPGARVDRGAGLVLVDSGLPCDTFNFVCNTRLSTANAHARVRDALAFFDVTGHPFSWWLGPGFTPAELPDVLGELGLAPAESETAMALDLRTLPASAPAVPGLAIARVRTPADLAAFAQVSAANWDPPDPQVIRYFAMAAEALLAPDAAQRLYLGRFDGEPAATAEATVGGGLVGLYNIATRPAFRRRGIAMAMTRAALIGSAADGLTTGILQASDAGVGVYERLGFRAFGTVTEFKPDAGPEAA